MNLRLRRIAVTAIAVIVGVSFAQPAHASTYGWVYISLPTWEGNCPGGGHVTNVQLAVGDTWSTPAGGDSGDDIVYAKVKLNEYQNASGHGWCGWYWGPAFSWNIKPTRNNQTVWIGPDGVRYN